MATKKENTAPETANEAGSDRVRRADLTKTVLIVGMSGAGKSNLGNKLLDNPTIDPFEEGKITSRAVTTTQTKRAEFNGLVVIDTPGVPNKDPGKTVAYFDAVVKALRREGSLNTLLVLINQKDDCPPELEEYAVLLEQFNHLPCSKLMVCRQPALTRQSRKTEEEKRHEGVKFVERVLDASRLNMPLVLLTEGYCDESYNQVEEIVNFVQRSERARVDVPTCRTSDELRDFVSRLADRATRLEALKHDVEEAEASLWNRTVWMASHVVPLAYVLASEGKGFMWTGPFVKREQETCAKLRAAIAEKKEEIDKGVVNEERLLDAQNVLSVLGNFQRGP